MIKVFNFFEKYNKPVVFSGIVLAVLSFFDKKLLAGAILVFFLVFLALFFINKIKNEKQKKNISILFLISFFLHIIAVLFVFYGNFQPFSDGRGDYLEYNLTAIEVANRIAQKNFSLEELPLSHYYPVIVGYIYYFTLPKMIVGELLNAWLVALTIIFVYLIAKELGRTDKEAFITGLIVNIYPSLAFFGSLMLKEAFVVFFSTAAILLSLILIKRFSWLTFALFYFALIGLTHFRFYIGIPLIFVFIVCWLLFSGFKLKRRIIFGGIMIFLMGFLPMISTVSGFEKGYFGINAILLQLNMKTIIYYREVAYNFRVDPRFENIKIIDDTSEKALSNPSDNNASPDNNVPPDANSSNPEVIKVSEILAQVPEGVPVPDIVTNKDWGQDSSVNIETGIDSPIKFVKNSIISFANAFFGPFPWQLRSLKHIFVLPEILLWWVCLFFLIRGVIGSMKNQYKTILPLLLFGIIVVAMISLYMTNFGLVTRIRMPAFVALLCLVPLGFRKMEKIKIPLLNKFFTE